MSKLLINEIKKITRSKEVKIDNNDSEKKFLRAQGLRTVPQVVINDELIGGFAETEAKMQGLMSINGI